MDLNKNAKLIADPYNIIITGVGGQGNVLASRMFGGMLQNQGLFVTIGETFGASQRGGSVMSHLRISEKGSWSPQIPLGKAHVVVALEPVEALRVLGQYGNPDVLVLTNTRSIYPASCISGDMAYPSMENLKEWISQMSKKAWFIDATNKAVELGHPIFGNVMMTGALSGIGILPVTRDDFENVVRKTMDKSKTEINLKAFDMGAEMVRE